MAKYLLTTFCLNIVAIAITVVVVNIYFRGLVYLCKHAVIKVQFKKLSTFCWLSNFGFFFADLENSSGFLKVIDQFKKVDNDLLLKNWFSARQLTECPGFTLVLKIHKNFRWVKSLFLYYLPLFLMMRRPESYVRQHKARICKRNAPESFLRHYPVGEYIEVSLM
jgi:hypothetical protein